MGGYGTANNFYPRSPCGERPYLQGEKQENQSISIHALLAESDKRAVRGTMRAMISIHALLAESDRRGSTRTAKLCDFYPRSPCGERLVDVREIDGAIAISIHALLAESDLRPQHTPRPLPNFYPRSPCGERPAGNKAGSESFKFLSTLSLRRATQKQLNHHK